jgi:hypothetical protein
MEITIKVERLQGLVKNGRVRAGEKLHLDVSRIKRVFAWRRKLYVVYETEKTDYYKQYVAEPPPYAVELQHKVVTYNEGICDICGSVIEWDADEPYCPRGCDEREDWSYHFEERKRLVLEPPKASEEVRQFVEKAFKVKSELVGSEFYNLAGGCRPRFKLTEVDFSLYEVGVRGLGVVENPRFECSDYDSPDIEERRYDGKYIAVQISMGTGLEILLYRYEGEPDLSVMQQLHEEYMAEKRKQEEERRRAEEEARRRMEEEERKWGDPAKVVEAIKAALPQWADGAVVVAKSVCGEDCDVYYYVYPVKRSQRGPGYYYSTEWRTLNIDVPDRFLEKLADHVVLKNGETLKVKKKEVSGRYISLTV